MPEGDTLYRAAVRARAHLSGQPIIECQTSVSRVDPDRLKGQRMRSCRSVGKHLLMQFGDDLWLHTHLGMNGRWRFANGRAHVSAGRGPNRLVLRTSESTAWCFGAPQMALLTGHELARHPQLSTLGPDILDRETSISTLRTAFRAVDGDPEIASALLDQRRCAGIGNVYKSECLFLTGIHPGRRLSALDDDTLDALLAETRKWMLRNVGPGRRGTRWPGRGQHWVYERGGERCLRCDAVVRRVKQGPTPRVTFFCPTCQPARAD